MDSLVCPSAQSLIERGHWLSVALGQVAPLGAGCYVPPAAMLWLTLLFCDCLPIVVQMEGPRLTPSQSSLVEAEAWDLVGELLGAEKDPSLVKRAPGKRDLVQCQSFSLQRKSRL